MAKRQRVVEVADPSLPKRPVASVLMITYNQASFIGRAIDSVLEQRTCFPYELVIGEDCSTDRTRQIVLGYQKQFPHRIRLVLQDENVGWRRNSVATFAACRGKFVALLEGDDYWIDPDKLQLQVDLLDRHPTAFICGARARIWRAAADGPTEITPAEDSRTLASYGPRELFEGKWWFRTCTKVFRRHYLERLPVDLVGEDWAGTLWLIANTRFGGVCFLDRIVAVYREHSGGVWSSLAPHQRAVSDIRSLSYVCRAFEPSERDYLKQVMAGLMLELVRTADADPCDRIASALRAAWCNPGDRPTWRRLWVSIRLAMHRLRASNVLSSIGSGVGRRR
jgi:glycosyltransferase involved in cell wall biosynthesis